MGSGCRSGQASTAGAACKKSPPQRGAASLDHSGKIAGVREEARAACCRRADGGEYPSTAMPSIKKITPIGENMGEMSHARLLNRGDGGASPHDFSNAGAARHLAAILAADVVGYSRLMGTEEERTTTFPKRVSPARTHHTIPDRPIATIA
jgi:hypothetical protein